MKSLPFENKREIFQKTKEFLATDVMERKAEEFRRHERTGRPLGGEKFIEKLKKLLLRSLCRKKPGPKPKKKVN